MTPPTLDVTPDDRLAALLDEVDGLASRFAPADDRLPRAVRVADAAVATLRLDGSPITGPTPLLEQPPPSEVTGPARGGWLEVLRSGAVGLDEAPDEVLLALEHRGAVAGLEAEDLTDGLRSDLPTALAALHRRVTDGLLAPEVTGRPRRTAQAVHDASLGRVLFFPVEPAHVGPRLEHLAAWLASSDAHPVVRSGVVHHQLLDLHPYEAANGRLARTAARLLLRADGRDGAGHAQPEAALRVDPIGYLDEVGRARRLRSPAAFVARWGEAVAAGLRAVLPPVPAEQVPAATRSFLRGVGDFTLADHRDGAGGRDADAALVTALDAGLATRLPGTRGLRWRSSAAARD